MVRLFLCLSMKILAYEACTTKNNNRSEFDLKDFIENQAAIGNDVSEYAQRSIPFYGLNRNDRREVKCAVKDNGRPYIPGSSLKGAIKGALLYDWFSSDGETMLNQLMHKTLKTFRNCEKELRQIAYLAGKRNVSREDKQQIRRFKREVKQRGGTQLEKDFDKVFAGLLTNDPKRYPRDFSHLKISDSTLFSMDALQLQLTKRLHYVKGLVTIPANLETIRAKAAASFKIAINPQFTHPNLQYLNGEKPLENLLDIINTFHKDNIDLELDMLDNYPWEDRARNRERAVFEKYIAFLEDLYDKMENAQPNEAYLCLGFGKSFFYNSIGMLVRDWAAKQEDLSENDQQIFRQYCELFFLGREGQKRFPLTRTVASNGVGMGWMKITQI